MIAYKPFLVIISRINLTLCSRGIIQASTAIAFYTSTFLLNFFSFKYFVYLQDKIVCIEQLEILLYPPNGQEDDNTNQKILSKKIVVEGLARAQVYPKPA